MASRQCAGMESVIAQEHRYIALELAWFWVSTGPGEHTLTAAIRLYSIDVSGNTYWLRADTRTDTQAHLQASLLLAQHPITHLSRPPWPCCRAAELDSSPKIIGVDRYNAPATCSSRTPGPRNGLAETSSSIQDILKQRLSTLRPLAALVNERGKRLMIGKTGPSS